MSVLCWITRANPRHLVPKPCSVVGILTPQILENSKNGCFEWWERQAVIKALLAHHWVVPCSERAGLEERESGPWFWVDVLIILFTAATNSKAHPSQHVIAFFIKIFSFITTCFYYVCVYTHSMWVMAYNCGGQVSLSIIWLPGIELRPLDLVGRCIYPLRHLDSPKTLYLTLSRRYGSKCRCYKKCLIFLKSLHHHFFPLTTNVFSCRKQKWSFSIFP